MAWEENLYKDCTNIEQILEKTQQKIAQINNVDKRTRDGRMTAIFNHRFITDGVMRLKQLGKFVEYDFKKNKLIEL